MFIGKNFVGGSRRIPIIVQSKNNYERNSNI